MMMPPERPFERKDGSTVGKSGPRAASLADLHVGAASGPALCRRGNLSRIIPDRFEYMAIYRW
jgi:hypothetical protein